MANIEDLTAEQEAHAKRCPKCKRTYERAVASHDALRLAACKRDVEACMSDERDRPRR